MTLARLLFDLLTAFFGQRPGLSRGAGITTSSGSRLDCDRRRIFALIFILVSDNFIADLAPASFRHWEAVFFIAFESGIEFIDYGAVTSACAVFDLLTASFGQCALLFDATFGDLMILKM